MVLFFDRNFFPLGSRTSCCPLYRHEKKRIKKPSDSFSISPLALQGISSACLNLFELSCQHLRDVSVQCWLGQRDMQAAAKKSSGAGAGRRQEQPDCRSECRGCPPELNTHWLTSPLNSTGECQSYSSIVANLGIPCDYYEHCHAFCGLQQAGFLGFCRSITKVEVDISWNDASKLPPALRK